MVSFAGPGRGGGLGAPLMLLGVGLGGGRDLILSVALNGELSSVQGAEEAPIPMEGALQPGYCFLGTQSLYLG